MRTANAMLRATPAQWSHSNNPFLSGVNEWLGKMAIGTTLNVCCGYCPIGDVRIDLDPNSSRTEEGDLFNLKYLPQSFDTVICDPPFAYYSRFKWAIRLSHLARKRFMLSTPLMEPKLIKREWKRELYYFSSNGGTQFLRLYWVFDRLNQSGAIFP